MTVSPISSSSPWTPTAPVQGGRHHHHGGMKAAETAAASALGMSADDLSSALLQGQTISSLAASKGVDMSKVTSAVSSAVAKADPSLSSSQADALAQRFVSGPHGDFRLASLPATGAATTPESLSDLASAQGVDPSTLMGNLVSALQQGDPSLSSGDASSLAQQLAALQVTTASKAASAYASNASAAGSVSALA